MNSIFLLLSIFYNPTVAHSDIESGKYRVTSYVDSFESFSDEHYVRVLKLNETEFAVMQDTDGPYYIGTIHKDTFKLQYGTHFVGKIHNKRKFEGFALIAPGVIIIYQFERVGPTFFNRARRESNLGD